MDDTKSWLPLSERGCFRYLVVSQVLARMGRGEDRVDAVRAVAATQQATPVGFLSVSERSIYRWLAAFEAEGGRGLEDKTRSLGEGSSVLSGELLEFLVAQRELDKWASIPELIRRARARRLVGQGAPICRQTVYRALVRMGISTQRRKRTRDRDARRFAYPHRMDMVLADGKHFKAGAKRLKRMAFFFLDDCSRCGLEVVVGTSENTALFLRGFYRTIRHHGQMGNLYLDRGPAFIAHDTAAVCAHLSIHLSHGEASYPEGHGKIERLNQTALNAVLRNLDRRPDVDPTCEALELRLRHWLFEVYNHEPHESLDAPEEEEMTSKRKQSPRERFLQDPKPLVFPESDEALRQAFVIAETRSVSKDRVVSIASVAYEVPRGLAGREVTIYRYLLLGTVAVLHKGRVVTVHPVDLAANARAHRARAGKAEEVDHPPPPSAAEMAFDEEFGPITGADGGFNDPANPEEK